MLLGHFMALTLETVATSAAAAAAGATDPSSPKHFTIFVFKTVSRRNRSGVTQCFFKQILLSALFCHPFNDGLLVFVFGCDGDGGCVESRYLLFNWS